MGLGVSFLAFVLSIPVGGNPAPAGFDVYGVVRVTAGEWWTLGPAQAVSTPWGYVASRGGMLHGTCLALEELTHARQAWALGIAYPVVYALTLGEALEPYQPRAFRPYGCEAVRGMWDGGPGLGPYPSAWARLCGGRWRFGAWPVAPGC